MKGHILILSANILSSVSMPVFKYLLTSDVLPEAITIMRAIFACMMFWVCSACLLSNGCKFLVNPNSGNHIAQGKGVHRKVESERSRRQTSGLTNRNFIQGI